MPDKEVKELLKDLNKQYESLQQRIDSLFSDLREIINMQSEVNSSNFIALSTELGRLEAAINSGESSLRKQLIQYIEHNNPATMSQIYQAFSDIDRDEIRPILKKLGTVKGNSFFYNSS